MFVLPLRYSFDIWFILFLMNYDGVQARRQRAELLQLRSNAHNAAARVNWIKHGDLLSKKLAW